MVFIIQFYIFLETSKIKILIDYKFIKDKIVANLVINPKLPVLTCSWILETETINNNNEIEFNKYKKCTPDELNDCELIPICKNFEIDKIDLNQKYRLTVTVIEFSKSKTIILESNMYQILLIII